MSEAAWVALGLSARVALSATCAILPPGIALGWWLARREVRGRALIETLTALPLVLPPTAIGYLLLRLFSRDGWAGERTLGFDLDLLFTWKGAVVASAVMAFPLVVRGARQAFEAVDPRLESIARTLGRSPWRTFVEVTLPLASRGLAAAAVLGFARALGEFGATVIVAGNIPGRTQTLALAIWSDLQLGRDGDALALVAVTAALSFVALWSVEMLTRRPRPRTGS